jgi:hypothetical protein
MKPATEEANGGHRLKLSVETPVPHYPISVSSHLQLHLTPLIMAKSRFINKKKR